MIKTVDLTKIYNKGKKNQVEAVTNANITAENGEITALVGPSGCGKTTLMSMIGQLLTPTNGKVLVDDEDITAYSDLWKAKFRRENVGFVFQHINLLPNLTALENVMIPLICHDVELATYKTSALQLLDDLGLSQRATFMVEQLSGGQQQRVAVARALITQPQIIIADEPLTFVDSESAQKIVDFFKKLREEGKTICISTHVSEFAQIADKTYVIKDGKVVNS
jgi:ABC-type lipoprotein export system ATPase subunit